MLTVGVETNVSQEYGYQIYILDSDGYVLAGDVCRTLCLPSEENSKSISIGLISAGTYFVYVKTYYDFGSPPRGSYKVKPIFEPGAPKGVEIEFNDTNQQAQIIGSGDSIKGTIPILADEDYFKVTTAAGSIVNVKFETSISQDSGYQLNISNSNGDILATEFCRTECTISKSSSKAVSLDLADAGSYFIQIKSYYDFGQPPEGSYQISIALAYLDSDGDSIPDYIDDDDDDDGVLDGDDAFPLDSSESVDTDSDGIGNNADPDDDNDTVLDGNDAFPLDSSESVDTDSDGIGNNADMDDDGDDAPDSSDVFPLDNSESKDSDFDGTGNNADLDDDNDGLPDTWEIQNQRDPVSADYDVDVGIWNSCGIDDTGVICWGTNAYGALDVPVLNNPTQVAAAFFHTCALDDTGVVCWGNARRASVPALTNPVQISARYTHTCALDDTGVVCWGDNDNGETTVPNLLNPTHVSAGEDFTCAIDNTGVVCWGDNSRGQLNVPTLVNPTQVSAGGWAACAKDDTGIVCWGYSRIASQIPPEPEYTQVETGGLHACAISESGVDCWGNNGGSDNRLAVPALDNTSQISASGHTCALNDRGISCWGKNNFGQSDTPALLIDPDDDGFSNQGGLDAFPLDKTEWLDTDSDGIGNNTDTDDDNDSVLDGEDAFPLDKTEWLDTDSDGIGNNADPDDDGDSILDGDDAFPLDATESVDTDSDGIGNNADTDDDGDSVLDGDDAFPLDKTEWLDTDSDGIGNNTDTDDDDDSVLDADDAFPLDATETVDTDSDGIGNNADTDDDGDAVLDGDDAFPLDSTESLDTDSDGVGDNSDAFPDNALYKLDSDSDGMPDAWETRYGLDPDDPSDATSDQDNDGVSALDEFLAGTIPSGSLDIDGNGQYDALTDGLLLLRGMFGLDGSALVTGTIASDAVFTESVDIESRIATLGVLADIDGNGEIDALTDGLLTLRYLFGLEGDTLIAGVVAADATRTTAADIEVHLKTLVPAL